MLLKNRRCIFIYTFFMKLGYLIGSRAIFAREVWAILRYEDGVAFSTDVFTKVLWRSRKLYVNTAVLVAT